VPTTQDLLVRCSAGAPGNWTDYNDFQVSLTPIDVVTTGTPAARPRTKGSSAAR